MSQRRAAQTSTTSTLSSSSTFPNNTSSTSGTMGDASRTTQARMGQILDDQDHKRCSEGNQRALLAEKLDQLRGLVKVLEADDWKYASTTNGAAHSGNSSSHGTAS